MTPSRVYTWISNAWNANEVPLVPDLKFSNVVFWNANLAFGSENEKSKPSSGSGSNNRKDGLVWVFNVTSW